MALFLLAWVLLGCARAQPAPALETPTPSGPTPLPTLTAVPTPVPGTLFVDAAQSLGPISPLVYGTNYGPWMVVPVDLQEEVQAAGLTYLRFPGGAYGDENPLQTYHIDQFIALARQLGAEPSISVRLRTGTPEEAAEAVRYVNVEKEYGVRYWSIGNEPTLYASAYDMEYDTERYNAEWRAFAEAMREVDPEIRFIGPDTHQFTATAESSPQDAAGRDWMREFLLANGDMIDVVSFHRYPFPAGGDDPPTIEELRANSREWEAVIPRLREMIRETTGRDLPIAVTEINSNWTHAVGGEATPDSHYNAIWWADVLGRLIRQRVEMVAHFALQAPRGSGWGMLSRYEVRPLYYVYRMYQQFGTDLVYASSDDPDLSIYAARREDGALTVMVVNLAPEEKTKPLRIGNFAMTEPAELWLFDEEHPAEQMGTQSITNGDTLTFPPQSVSLYVLK
ncbi:MAG TPA: glycoside hydrolase family 44 protein [Ardenticatenaceae bacterium]